MKVCNLILFYYPYYSGRGVYWKKVMREMGKLGITSWVLAANYDNLLSLELVDDVRVHRVSLRKYEHQVVESLKIALSLFRLKDEFDILHLHGYCDAWGIILLFMKMLRKKVIFHMTLFGSDDPLTWRRNYKFMSIRYKIIAGIDKFVSHSPPITDSYKKSPLPDSKLVEIPNGVLIDKFKPAENYNDKVRIRKCLDLSVDVSIACFVGAVIERKGVHALIDLWGQDNCINNHCILLIVGPYSFAEEGEGQREYCKKIFDKVKKNKLNVKFVGSVDNVAQYMQCADFFVFPSRQEGFGNVLIEALASGLPVITTPLDGISKRILGDSAGFIVTAPNEWVEKIKLLIFDDDSRNIISAAARKRAVDTFDLSLIVNDYIAIYSELADT